MESRLLYQQQLIEEIQGLSAPELGRLIKLVHLVREEFLPSKPAAKIPLASFVGCLNDLGDDQIFAFDTATARRSLFADREPLA